MIRYTSLRFELSYDWIIWACRLEAQIRPYATEMSLKPNRPIPENRRRLPAAAFALALACAGAATTPAFAAPDTKPYDDKLMRLSEIVGAVHYLRELCGANEGQFWRERMRELMDAEGGTALRRARLTRAFNQGYRSYSRTYNSCSQSAQTAITRFITEGAQLSEGLVKSFP